MNDDSGEPTAFCKITEKLLTESVQFVFICNLKCLSNYSQVVLHYSGKFWTEIFECTANILGAFIFTDRRIWQILRRELLTDFPKKLKFREGESPLTHIIHVNTPSVLPHVFAYKPQCWIYLLERRFFALKIANFFSFLPSLSFFFQFCALPFTIWLSVINISLGPALRLLLNSVCLMLSFYPHLASQLRKFWV